MQNHGRVLSAEPKTSGVVPGYLLLETSTLILALGSCPNREIEHAWFDNGCIHVS